MGVNNFMSIEKLKENLKIELDEDLVNTVLFYVYNHRNDDLSIEEFFKIFKEVFNDWADEFKKELINREKEEN